MGLGFYGRSFVAESSSCMAPGCKYASGTPEWTCSQEIGVLMNSEIDYNIDLYDLEPVFDEEAAVKIVTWNDNY